MVEVIIILTKLVKNSILFIRGQKTANNEEEIRQMSERVQSPKPRQLTRKIVAATAAFALAPLAGCSASPELQAREDATRQVFADVIGGKTASKDPFGGNTFTVSIKDAYPNTDMNDLAATHTAGLYTYKLGQKLIRNAFGIRYEPARGNLELETLAVCDTAGLTGLMTGDQLKTAQDQWDYYQQLGGLKVLENSNLYSDAYTDAFTAILALKGTCMNSIGEALRSGADVTFVPAVNS